MKTHVLASALWVLAFIFSLPLFQPYEIGRLAAVACLFIGAGLALADGLARREGLRVPASPVLVLLLALWALAATSLAWSGVFSVSYTAFCTVSLLPAGALLFVCAPDGARRAGQVALFILTALSLWVWAQVLVFQDFLVYGQVRHPFADPNAFSALLALGFFPAAGVMIGGSTRLIRTLALAAALLMLTAIIAIGGRAVMLAVLAVLPVFLWMVRAHLAAHKRCGLALVAAAIAAFILPDWLGQGLAPWARLMAMFGDAGTVADTRLSIWDGVAKMIAAAPLMGAGIGTFFFYYPAHRLPADIVSGGFSAHNDPLQFWSEMGVLAPLLFYGILMFAALRMISFMRDRAPGDAGRILPAALFCGLAVIGLHAHVNSDFYVAPLACLSGLILAGWILAVKDREWVVRLPQTWPRSAATFLVGLPVLGMLFLLQGILISDYHLTRARIFAQGGDLERFALHVNEAGRTGFGLNARAYALAATVPLGLLEGGHLPSSERDAVFKQADGLLEKAQRHNERLTDSLYYKARLYTAAGRDSEAVLQNLLAIAPHHLPARLMLVDLYEAQGRKDEGYEILKAGLPWPYIARDPAPFFARLSALAAARGDAQTLGAIAERQHFYSTLR